MANTTEDLRASLRVMSEGFRRLGGAPGSWMLGEVVLRLGVECVAQPFPRRWRRRPPKQCFANAAALVRRAAGLTYCEGFVARPPLALPVHHAWAINEDREVFDPTLDDPEVCAYIGVPITRADYDAQTHHGRSDSASVFLTAIGTVEIDYILAKCPAMRELMP